LSLLDLDDPEFPRMRITKKGKKALASGRSIPVMIPWPLPAKEVPIPVDEAMYERLREVRNKLAREEGLPPYCVAPNLSLVELINRGISTIDGLQGVPGIGAGRSEKYGARLLEVLEG
jgi:superfamily II DNA helicase RecQ